jgi:hypothetical protein
MEVSGQSASRTGLFTPRAPGTHGWLGPGAGMDDVEQ